MHTLIRGTDLYGIELARKKDELLINKEDHTETELTKSKWYNIFFNWLTGETRSQYNGQLIKKRMIGFQ